MEIHPIAKCYPPLPEAEFAILKESIRNIGQLNPIAIYEGMVLEGSQRYRACQELGITPKTHQPKIADPISYVVAQNEHRRHLTPGQRASIAEELASLQWGGDKSKKSKSLNDDLKLSRPEAAKLLKVSPTAIDRVRIAKKHGIPEIIGAVKAGKIEPDAAYKLSRLPVEQQPSALNSRLMGNKNKIEPLAKTEPNGEPPDKVPERLMHGILTPDTVGQGFAVYTLAPGKYSSLAPNVSELEHRERTATTIGGSWLEKDLVNYAKWEKFEDQGIAEKVLKLLEHISPLQIEATKHGPAFTKVYDLGKSGDLRELVTMLSSHLFRMVETLELREKYGHIKYSPEA